MTAVSLKEGTNRILAALGGLFLVIVGIALLGAGLIVGLAFLGIVAVAYLVSKIFFRDKIKVRTARIASCPACGRITDRKTCGCGQRVV